MLKLENTIYQGNIIILLSYTLRYIVGYRLVEMAIGVCSNVCWRVFTCILVLYSDRLLEYMGGVTENPAVKFSIVVNLGMFKYEVLIQIRVAFQ